MTPGSEIKELILDVADWTTADDVYESFFQAVSAPVWHGRDFNALRDSIWVGQINGVEVPYRLVIANYEKLAPTVKTMADDFVGLINELHCSGVPVEIKIETGTPDA